MEKFKSRKFWAAVAGSLMPIVAELLTGKLTWQVAIGMAVTVLVGYIAGQGYVDGKAVDAQTSEAAKLLSARLDALANKGGVQPPGKS